MPADAGADRRAETRLISFRFLVLRASSAAGAFGVGFVQTFVFARVLSPERFSIYILLAAIGGALWVCDLGLAKILFVELRAARLADKSNDRAAAHATAVILFYLLLAVVTSLVCFAITVLQPAYSLRDATNFALFFLYIALILSWISLRSISIAVDEYLFYERLELTRRVVNIATMLAMLVGLSFDAFVISSNVMWLVLLTLAASRLVRRGALAPRIDGLVTELRRFIKSNGRELARSSTYALSELFNYMFPYFIVPVIFGLGAPVIILEVTFRIFRGATMIYTAASDLAVPGQTRAFAARNARGLIRTTIFAVALCCVPALAASALLLFAAQPLFDFLLHTAAAVPSPIAPILVVLLFGSVVQMVSQSLLQYTGFFREISRVGIAIVGTMIAMTTVAILAKFDVVGFIAAYAAVYAAGATAYAIAAIRGPIRAASLPKHP